MPDLKRREYWLLSPLVVLVLYFGVNPTAITSITSPSVEKLVSDYQAHIAKDSVVIEADADSYNEGAE